MCILLMLLNEVLKDRGVGSSLRLDGSARRQDGAMRGRKVSHDFQYALRLSRGSCYDSQSGFPSGLGCCVRLPGLVFLLSPVLSPNLSPVWDAVSASLVLSCSCLPTCHPSWLGCCVRVSVLSSSILSPVLSPNLSPVWDAVSAPNLSPIWAGALRPPPWSCLSLVSGLVSQLVSGLGCCVRSQLVSHLGWGAASASLVSSFSCLRSCLPTCLRSGMLCPPP